MIAPAKRICANQPCDLPPVRGEKYCNRCRHSVLKELKDSGYLGRVPRNTRERSEDAQENTRETKFGVETGVYGPKFD